MAALDVGHTLARGVGLTDVLCEAAQTEVRGLDGDGRDETAIWAR